MGGDGREVGGDGRDLMYQFTKFYQCTSLMIIHAFFLSSLFFQFHRYFFCLTVDIFFNTNSMPNINRAVHFGMEISYGRRKL